MKNYSFYRYHLIELHLSIKLIIDFLEPLKESNPEVGILLTKLNLIFTEFDKALKKKKISDLTAEKKQADETQDYGFLSWRYYVESCLYQILNPEYKAPAGRIMEAIKRHGYSLQNLSYSDQAAASTSLINEMEQPQFVNDQTTIGSLDLFHAWTGAVENFQKVSQQKIEEQADDDTEAAHILRKEVMFWMEKTLLRIEDMITWTNDAFWINLNKKIEVGLDDIEAQVKARRTRRKHENEEIEQPG
ncbi:hypothetical protein DMA11_03590 [Marinilabiliaceae bacterium JC017]|nr:hypothetical protein DMA11_03590 [Marinilabiliaceae bacterium JC017]